MAGEYTSRSNNDITHEPLKWSLHRAPKSRPKLTWETNLLTKAVST